MLPPSDNPSPATPRKHRFLVVDDEPIVVKILASFLEDVALTIAKAHSAEEALVLLQNNEFDMLITDRFMPGMDGIELIQKASLLKPDLKTILISGVATKPVGPDGSDVADLFMPKPFSKPQLLQEVAQLLESKTEAA